MELPIRHLWTFHVAISARERVSLMSYLDVQDSPGPSTDRSGPHAPRSCSWLALVALGSARDAHAQKANGEVCFLPSECASGRCVVTCQAQVRTDTVAANSSTVCFAGPQQCDLPTDGSLLRDEYFVSQVPPKLLDVAPPAASSTRPGARRRLPAPGAPTAAPASCPATAPPTGACSSSAGPSRRPWPRRPTARPASSRRVRLRPMRPLHLQGGAAQKGRRRGLLPAQRVRVGKLQLVQVSRPRRLRAGRAGATGDGESSGQPLRCAVDLRRRERRAPAERPARRRPPEEPEAVRASPGGGPLRTGRPRRDRARPGVRRSERDRQGCVPGFPRRPSRQLLLSLDCGVGREHQLIVRPARGRPRPARAGGRMPGGLEARLRGGELRAHRAGGPDRPKRERRNRLGWIAVSGEDNSPHRPVNVPSSNYPQFDVSVPVRNASGNILTVMSRYVVAQDVPRRAAALRPPSPWPRRRRRPSPRTPRCSCSCTA